MDGVSQDCPHGLGDAYVASYADDDQPVFVQGVGFDLFLRLLMVQDAPVILVGFSSGGHSYRFRKGYLF